MSNRELIVLGSSSQVPTRTRAHNAAFLAWDNMGLLFDPGEGTQRQLIHAGIPASRITHILITHLHGDHSLGLAGVAQRLSLDGVTHAVHLVYPAEGEPYVERLLNASVYLQLGRFEHHPVSAAGEVLRFPGGRIVAEPLEHGTPCFGYRLEEADGRTMDPVRLKAAGVTGSAIGELIRLGAITIEGRHVPLDEVSEPRPGQAFAFVMDTRVCEGARRLLRNADLAVCESTYLSDLGEHADAVGHLTASGAARLALAAGVRRLALTHFSSRYEDLEPFRSEASAIHPDVVVCEDLSRVRVPGRT